MRLVTYNFRVRVWVTGYPECSAPSGGHAGAHHMRATVYSYTVERLMIEGTGHEQWSNGAADTLYGCPSIYCKHLW